MLRNIIKNSLTYKENELIKKSSFFLQKILDKIKLISYNTKHALEKEHKTIKNISKNKKSRKKSKKLKKVLT